MQTARPILDLRGKLITTYLAYEIESELALVDAGTTTTSMPRVFIAATMSRLMPKS